MVTRYCWYGICIQKHICFLWIGCVRPGKPEEELLSEVDVNTSFFYSLLSSFYCSDADRQ